MGGMVIRFAVARSRPEHWIFRPRHRFEFGTLGTYSSADCLAEYCRAK